VAAGQRVLPILQIVGSMAKSFGDAMLIETFIIADYHSFVAFRFPAALWA
jgi:hypothetical protein